MDVHPLTSSTPRTTRKGQQGTAHTTADVSLRGAAAVAGLGLLVMAVLAFASFAVFGNLVATGDAAKTARNIVDHELLFRATICGFLIVAVLDVVVAWALYVLLRPAGRSIALLAAWFRVVYAALFAAALSNLFVAARLPTDADSLESFGAGRLNAQVLMYVNAFDDGYHAALAIFGLHLLVLGYLVFKSGYIPRVLGILVMIASFGYLIDGFGGSLSAGYNANLIQFTFIGEVLLMVWLLWKGVRLKNHPQREI
ncbi:MAG TPA: DUF4386 domain-containing protein [Rubrobacteraceae bacterium]|nr:DUF4386 domain-containing protein [Rubrobacteraceae bacterium]